MFEESELRLIALASYGVCIVMLLSLILVAVILGRRDRKGILRSFLFAVGFEAAAMACEAFVWINEGSPDCVTALTVFQALSMLCSYEVLASFIRCLFCIVGKEHVAKADVVAGLAVPHVLSCVAFVSVFTGWTFCFTDAGYYVQGPFQSVSQLLILFVDIYIVVFMLRKRKLLSLPNMVFMLLLILCSGGLSAIEYWDMILGNICISVSLTLMYIIVIQNMAFRHAEQENTILKMESELHASRVDAMVAQVKPHFLYNTLATAAGLCLTDPEKAYLTISNFGKYLRTNIESVQLRAPVPFEKELNYVETYLSLEKERFGDRLLIEYDIRVKDFLIPAITVQPVAENAVKHGITLLPDGGRVIISSYDDDGYNYVAVRDNGCGFDMSEPIDESRHIGLANVRFRLKMMVDGTLEVKSAPGCGTEVIIKIPKGNK